MLQPSLSLHGRGVRGVHGEGQGKLWGCTRAPDAVWEHPHPSTATLLPRGCSLSWGKADTSPTGDIPSLSHRYGQLPTQHAGLCSV